MTGLLSAVTVFHLLVLLRIIPYNAVWAGHLKSDSEMYVFESVSLLLNLFLLYVVLQKAAFVRRTIPVKALNIILYSFAVLFFLNTIGNLFAQHVLERTLGSALTLVSSYLCWQIARIRTGTSAMPIPH